MINSAKHNLPNNIFGKPKLTEVRIPPRTVEGVRLYLSQYSSFYHEPQFVCDLQQQSSSRSRELAVPHPVPPHVLARVFRVPRQPPPRAICSYCVPAASGLARVRGMNMAQHKNNLACPPPYPYCPRVFRPAPSCSCTHGALRPSVCLGQAFPSMPAKHSRQATRSTTLRTQHTAWQPRPGHYLASVSGRQGGGGGPALR